jgi:hypothetical protein
MIKNQPYRFAVALLTTAFSASALAQANEPGAPPASSVREEMVIAQLGDGFVTDFRRIMPDHFGAGLVTQLGSPGKRVTGMPYSAEIVSERLQTLPDGNQISHKQTQMVYRDSEGRTRQERIDNAGKSTVVINDPVSKRRYVVTPARRTAIALPTIDLSDTLEKARQRIERVKVITDGKVRPTSETPGSSATPKITTESRVALKVDRDGQTRTKTITIGPSGAVNVVNDVNGVWTTTTGKVGERAIVDELIQLDGGDRIGTVVRESLAQLGPLLGLAEGLPRELMPSHEGETSTRALGSRDINGVRAEGKLTTRTIAAGKVGNRAPIVITQESWFSPELQITVHSRHNDPRFGESIYSVNNLKRVEPTADLFKVPADYTVRGTMP